MLGVARRELEAGAEVLEAGRVDPRVVALERGHPDLDGRRPEQLRERRRHRLDPRLTAREVHVGVDRVAHGREHAPLGLELLARDTQRLPEAQPRLDAAGPRPRAVMVDDPSDPLAADVEVGAVREDRRVLEGDAALVVEAVRDPALQLLARELARVHAHVERVEVVVPAPLRAQPGDELLGRPGWLRDGARSHGLVSCGAYRRYR